MTTNLPENNMETITVLAYAVARDNWNGFVMSDAMPIDIPSPSSLRRMSVADMEDYAEDLGHWFACDLIGCGLESDTWDCGLQLDINDALYSKYMEHEVDLYFFYSIIEAFIRTNVSRILKERGQLPPPPAEIII